MRFADDTTLAADGVDDVLIMKRDGVHSLIKDVLYIPGIKYNLLINGKLLEKDYTIHMEHKILHVLDQAHMATNRTFNIELKVMEHRCIATATSREEWLWHYHLGHLNFRDLDALHRNGMVTGLPRINVPPSSTEFTTPTLVTRELIWLCLLLSFIALWKNLVLESPSFNHLSPYFWMSTFSFILRFNQIFLLAFLLEANNSVLKPSPSSN